MDENKYTYKSYKSIHTIYYIIPNNVSSIVVRVYPAY